MNRYVDAAAVRAAIVKAREAALEHKPYGWEWENNGYNGAILAAGRVPAADVRPVKRGEWKETMEPMGWTEEACAECSVCGETFVLDEYAIEDIQREFKFCPNCGADMRPVTDDGQ